MMREHLPIGWIEERLADVIEPRGEKVSPSDFPECKFIGMDHVESQTTKIIGFVPASKMKSNASRFYAGDVLYGRLRPYLNKVTQPNFDGLASAEFIVFSDTPLVRANFLKYRLNAGDFVNFASHLNEGDRPRVGFDQIGDFKLLIPPPNEQKRIVTKLEELFSELDKGIENLKTAREQLKVYRQAFLKHAFANIQQKIALEEVSEAVGGYAFKSASFKTDSGKYQVIRMGNVRPGTIREGESSVFLDDVDEKILDRYLLKRGDVLITLTGTRNKRDYGFTAVVRNDHYLLNQRIAYLRFNQAYLPEFFLYFSWTEDFKHQFFGHETGIVGQGNVGMKAIRSTMVPNIEISEQERIIQRLESNFTTIEALERTIEAELQKSEALRQSILKKAFSGKLVAQDPNDEPASMLLERIGAEKKFHLVNNTSNHQHEIKPVNKYVQDPLFQETAV